MSRANPNTPTKPLEFRCTRADVYSIPDCLGHLDTTGRQGHYITAATAEDAARTMFAKYPEDSTIDVQKWDPYGSDVVRFVRNQHTITSNRIDIKPA